MGQTHASGNYFADAAIKDNFSAVQALWADHDLALLIDRLKEMTLNFSLDKVKFAKLLQLSAAYEDLVAAWFTEFSHDRASQVVDGLEFLAASIMVSQKVTLFRKTCLLFVLFDLDKTDCIRKDEFTIFLKAAATGLHRMVAGLPPPATVMELGALSGEFFSNLGKQVLSQHDLLMWMTEAHVSMHYLSVLSKLGSAIFAWGANHRYQLGLDLEPRAQRVPAPILQLESVRVASVASSESHCLFLSEEGAVWSCGSGFCGILGHGDIKDSPQPRLIEALSHTRVVDVAVGIRHSVAVSDKGQVFTWGSADMGQLGHGSTEDREIHEWAYDPRTGGTFAYVVKPTVLMGLFGQRIMATQASCCNFSTAILTDQGHLYTWGNNTDGACGQGQKCPDHQLIYVDPHMQRTAMQALIAPRRVDVDATFVRIASGGYHMLAIDSGHRLWSWGRGLWGALGHGDQRSMYEPKVVDTLRYHSTHDIVAGEAHSLCMCALYRLTITGSSPDVALSPFSLLGLPAGRVDRHMDKRQLVTPPTTNLQLNAFVCSRMMQIQLPHRYDADGPLVSHDKYPLADIQESIVLMERGLWEGEWLKLDTTDFDFCLRMSPSGAPLPGQPGMVAHIMFGVEGKWEVSTDCVNKICVFDCPAHLQGKTLPEELSPGIVDFAVKCQQGRGLACLFILPKTVELFDVQYAGSGGEGAALKRFPFGVMTHEHGTALKKHITRLINMRIAEAADGVPEDVRDWRECHEEFTGKMYFENVATGQKRWAPPQIGPGTEATLISIEEDTFMQKLQAMVALGPKGIVVSQQSWRPDVELLVLEDPLLDELEVPIVTVSYEAGEELKSVATNGSQPWVAMEIQPYGGVYAFGNGTFGQLGLAGIENQSFLQNAQNALTNEANTFANRPFYVAHLHEHQVTNIASGAAHSMAVTLQGEVFTWGSADGLGVPLGDKSYSEVPVFVDQLEGLVKCKRAFAGHYHSFVVADMPYRSIV